jgi:hypothetical protein
MVAPTIDDGGTRFVRAATIAALAALTLGATLLANSPVRAQQRLDTVNTIGCAQEGGICRMPYPTNVYFGVPGRTNGRPFPQGGAVACNVQSFGDPAPGQRKSCWYAPRIADGGGARSRGNFGDRRDGYRDRDDAYRDRRDGYRDRSEVDRGDDRPRRTYDDYGSERRRYRGDPDAY